MHSWWEVLSGMLAGGAGEGRSRGVPLQDAPLQGALVEDALWQDTPLDAQEDASLDAPRDATLDVPLDVPPGALLDTPLDAPSQVHTWMRARGPSHTLLI